MFPFVPDPPAGETVRKRGGAQGTQSGGQETGAAGTAREALEREQGVRSGSIRGSPQLIGEQDQKDKGLWNVLSPANRVEFDEVSRLTIEKAPSRCRTFMESVQVLVLLC